MIPGGAKHRLPVCPTLAPDRLPKLSVLTGCSAQARKGTGLRLSAGVVELLVRSDMAEVEETLKRLQSQKGVQGIIVVNTEGGNRLGALRTLWEAGAGSSSGLPLISDPARQKCLPIFRMRNLKLKEVR
ncbi:dynein light chain roadblock-type 1 isoform X2 [Diceros bicornis minor]|uniref:dynein light chain roadblock-type 1 isoform X2 n=1 Tax=Diceros bicornis minor TaxID=77932 RepID=UPI0026EEA542|nr:dynein light chain roadblock-type 1 isoform X2 [Diceros bicornis minor]